MTLRRAIALLLLIGGVAMQGCANVKPWERETLAEPAMQLDSNPTVSSCDDHIYFSREASKGGRGFGGGGCGCN
jgi:hypothetical protein